MENRLASPSKSALTRWKLPMLRLSAVLIVFGTNCLAFMAVEPTADDMAALALALRPMILDSLPKPLYEKSDNWGNTTMAFDRVKWRRLRPQVTKAPKNDGTWRKTRVTARDPDTTLEFRLSDVRTESMDRLTFKAFVALMVNVEHEEEIWERGIRLFRDTTEGRLRIKANLDIESTMRIEAKAGALIPDTVFRLRATNADVSYDNLVFEQIGGIGGTGARWLGEVLRSSLKKWKPSIERELLARANAAVVKAADTREVRISLSSLWSRGAAAKK
jgi:hypothetical protein